MKYIYFFNLIFVFFVTRIQIRYLDALVEKKIITKNLSSVFFLIYIKATLIIGICFVPKMTYFYGLYILLNITNTLVPFIVLKYRQSLIDKGFPGFLDRVLLKVSVGQNLPEAILGLASREMIMTQHFYVRLARMLPMSKVQLEAHKGSRYDFYIQELIEISKEPYNMETRLQALVEQLKKYANYRRKSRNILFQPRFQALFMTTLYLLLLVVSLKQFTFFEIKEVILTSLAFNLLGLIILFNMGRFIRWRV